MLRNLGVELLSSRLWRELAITPSSLSPSTSWGLLLDTINLQDHLIGIEPWRSSSGHRLTCHRFNEAIVYGFTWIHHFLRHTTYIYIYYNTFMTDFTNKKPTHSLDLRNSWIRPVWSPLSRRLIHCLDEETIGIGRQLQTRSKRRIDLPDLEQPRKRKRNHTKTTTRLMSES